MANAPLNSTSPPLLRIPRDSSNFFCKFFIILLVLLTIPLFPSQPPEFTTFSTIFTKLWEPLQLLFVGLAVCYGLFCKRSTTSTTSSITSSTTNNEAQDLCFYGGLDISSFFEDGFWNSCGYDGKRVILKSEESCGLDEGKGGMEKDDVIEDKITKGWNSRYLPGESIVVVANGDRVVDELGENVPKRGYKSLNLPVRSLRSGIVVADKCEGSAKSQKTDADYSVEGCLRIRGVRPINLDKKFEEVSLPASPESWQARSCMMEMEEGMRRRRESSHLRLHSTGEYDFEDVKPRPSRYPLSCSSSSKSYSLGDLDIDSKSLSTEVSVPRIASEESFVASNSLHLRFGSSLDMTLQTSNKETNLSQKEDNFNGDKQGSSSVNFEVKPTNVSRVLSRGKSVRTIRSSKIFPYEMRGTNTGESNAGKVNGEIRDSSILNLGGQQNPEVEMKSNIDNHYTEPAVELLESQSEDKQDCFESSSITSRDNSESESQSYPSSSDEEVARSDIEGSEVDRKAGEFIAKFREQIRLQKLVSAKPPGNTGIS